METTVKERLKEFISTLGISEREFCRRVGVGSAFIQSIRKSIMPDTLNKIAIQYPQLNPVWLLLGNGEMLQAVEEVPEDVEPRPSEMLYSLFEEAKQEKARLLSIIESQQRIMESQQRTIENLTELSKKAAAQPGEVAGCADVG